MKRFSKYMIAAGALLCAFSCTNLDEEVYSYVTKEAFFTSEAAVVSYSARAYSSLQGWGTEQSMWTMNLQLGNEVAVPRNYVGEWAQERYGELQSHDIPATNKLILQSWNFCFNGIAACNDVIDALEKSGKDFDGRDRIIAEMKVLRAFYYMWAIDGWGAVPYSVSKDQEGYPVQKSRAEMFNFIENELKTCAPLLADEVGGAYYGRMTKGAADMILAKLYMNAEVWTGTARYAEAATLCKQVIDSGKYSLTNTYKENFAVHNESSTEAVLAIPYSTVFTESDHNSFIAFVLTLDTVLGNAFGLNATCWDGFVGQPDFLASYEPGDTRKGDTWLTGQQYDLTGKAIDGYIIDPDMPESAYKNGRGQYQGARICKWDYQADGLLTGDQTSMENDFIVLRYSDLVLMYAECLVQTGRAGEAGALDELKKIRTRAGLAPLGTPTLDQIYAERSHELALEGWVRQDLIRFGKYNDAWWAKKAGESYMLLLPVPSEILATNTNLSQNTGYTK